MGDVVRVGHTKGPWRQNGYAVVSDNPAPGIGGSDEIKHYGGHLICESVNGPNGRLIAAAPALLEALKAYIAVIDACLLPDTEIEKKARAAIFAATGSAGE